MPYKYEKVDVDDFECNLLMCTHNDRSYCNFDENIENLKANEEHCLYYLFNKNKEYIISKYGYSESDIPDIIEAYKKHGIEYKEIEKESKRFILKTINDKSTLFRISKEEEEEYYFFSSTEGGVDLILNIIREADLFNDGME